jgi:uncharacterized protein YggE
MAAVLDALKRAGVAPRDTRTANVSLSPQYRYAENQPPAVTGYQANNSIAIRFRDIAKAGAILDALVATGANQIQGPSFDIEDKDAVLDEARALALDKARARADGYAKRLGLRVLRVISIDESGGRSAPLPVHARAVMMEQASAGNASAPIAAGENVLGLGLDVVYELGK